MFSSTSELAEKLRLARNVVDPVTLEVVYLAAAYAQAVTGRRFARLRQDGVGVCGSRGHEHVVERLQCYVRITEEKVIGRFDEALQKLFLEAQADHFHEAWSEIEPATHAGLLCRRSTIACVAL